MHARILYDACPLCEHTEGDSVGTASCAKHPLYLPSFPDTMRWLRCGACGHVFADGYFGEAALAELFSTANPNQLPPGADVERLRQLSSRMVERVVAARAGALGKWIDVGFGNGALVATAAEFGFEVLGLDTRAEAVQRLLELGYPALQGTLEALESPTPVDVVSFADVLEHMPFPRKALAKARSLLGPRGVLLVSLPNLDSLHWRVMDRAKTNPYWGELEHLHNFSRQRLYSLLNDEGFEAVGYAVSERYLAGMEVVARRAQPAMTQDQK